MVRQASCALLVLDNTTKKLKGGRKRVGRIYVKLREHLERRQEKRKSKEEAE